MKNQMDMEDLVDAVVAWGRHKNITNSHKQYLKFCEEVGELSSHYLRDDRQSLIDDLGDVTVTLIILADIMGAADALKSVNIGQDVEAPRCLLDLQWEVVNVMYDFFDEEKLYDFLGEKKQAVIATRYKTISLHLKSLAKSLNLDLTYCLMSAYTEIATRTGKTIDGTFVKASDL